MHFKTIDEIAAKWEITPRQVRSYCADGRISGATMGHGEWQIPSDAVKPKRKSRRTFPTTVLGVLEAERSSRIPGGLYHRFQIDLAYNSNHIEGSRLTREQTRWIFETKTIGEIGSDVPVDDIVENPYNLEIIQVLNTTIPTSLADYDFGLITGSIVWNAREIVDPSSALAQEDILPHLVLQVTVKEQDKDAAWAKAIVDAYHSDEFKAYLAENNTGMWWIPEELR